MNKKICFLIASYVPHQVTLIKELLLYNCQILVFHKNKTGVEPKFSSLISYSSFEYSTEKKFELIVDFNPSILVSSGWMFQDYTRLCGKIKRKTDILTIAYTDTPWYGRITQKINALISPFYIKRSFDYIWVAGIRQYDYARKLCFDNKHIIFNCLSANTSLFNTIPINEKQISSSKNILYIGRFTEVKGLNYLLNAWNTISNKKGWTLTLIGDGELKSFYQSQVKDSSIVIKDYMPQEKLLREFEKSSCFILPSVYEPWALVIHEAAAAGLPIICTDVCGAAPHFVIDGYNGYKVNPYSKEELYIAINKILNADSRDLIQMSYNSRKLSTSITPELTAASLMQLIIEK